MCSAIDARAHPPTLDGHQGEHTPAAYRVRPFAAMREALTGINSQFVAMGQTEEPSRPCVSHVVDPRLIKNSTTLRFAVATFDTWDSLSATVENLESDGIHMEAICLLGLAGVLGCARAHANLPAATYRNLPFPDSHPLICCTTGLLAERFACRLEGGARTLKASLGNWLIPRHAGQIEDAVNQGKIVLWVHLIDAADEPLAYRSLLAGSSHSVGVHDFTD
jgi:hypothetical protein